jgi:hypothetical protein
MRFCKVFFFHLIFNLPFHIEEKNLLFGWLALYFTGRATFIFGISRGNHMPALTANVMQFATWVAGLYAC